MGAMDTARTVGMALERALPVINEEAALVAELQAGSEEAFTYVPEVYQNAVLNLVSRILVNVLSVGTSIDTARLMPLPRWRFVWSPGPVMCRLPVTRLKPK